MTRTIRLLLVLVGLLLVLAAGAAVALSLLVDAEAMRGTVEQRLSAALGRPVRLGEVSFSLATGLALRARDLRVDPPADDPSASVLTARQVDVWPRLFPLLRRRVAVRSIQAEGLEVRQGDRTVLRNGALSARVDLEGAALSADGRFAAVLAGAGDPAVDLRGAVRRSGPLTEVTGLEGTLGGSDLAGEIRLGADPSGPTLSFNLRSRNAVLDELAALAGALPSGHGPPLTGSGSYTARTGTLAGRPVTGFEAQVRLAGNRVHLDPVSFTLHGGRCGGALEIDTSDPALPFRVSGRAEGIDAAAFSAALRGRAGATVDVRGRAGGESVLPTLDGTLGFELADGAVQSVGLLEQVAVLLESAGGRGIGRDETPFDRAGGTLALAGGQGRTDDLRLESPDFGLTGAGRIDLAGPLDLDVTAAFSSEVSAAIVGKTPHLRAGLDPSGRLTLPLRVRGTLAEPEVRIDTSRMAREVLRDRIRERKERLLDLLRR